MGIDISNIPIIDTHEHLHPESERIQFGGDLFATFFSHYTSTDLKLAGLSNQAVDNIRDPGVPVDERWNIVKPYWELTK